MANKAAAVLPFVNCSTFVFELSLDVLESAVSQVDGGKRRDEA